MFALLRRHLPRSRDTSQSSLLKSRLTPPAIGTLKLLILAAPILWGNTVQAQDSPDLRFQTSGVRRCASIGDWYTTGGIGDNTTGECGPLFNGGAAPNNPGFHSYFVNISPIDLEEALGNSVTITVLDAESNGPDDEVFDDSDPTRFSLIAPGGGVIDSQVFDGAPNGTNYTFPPITTPGVYEVRSETGDFYINGPASDSFERNNDDNSFNIQSSLGPVLIGELNGSFQQDSGGDISVDLFFLVGPGTSNLFLRNFDLDNGADISYTDPEGTVFPGTASGQSNWNGGAGDLDNGGDALTLNLANTDRVGRWQIDMRNYTTQNQTALESRVNGVEAPLFDNPPERAGNFTIVPNTTRTTTIGTEVCHRFTVTNNFFTTDIINLELTGTDPNYTVELRAANATTALTDNDGDEVIDTGILGIQESRNFNLCVTPQPGAPPRDTTTISATSFIDARIREQAVASGVPGVDPAPSIQSVVKTTSLAGIGLAQAISAPRTTPNQPDVLEFDITYVVTNTGVTPLTEVQITNDLQDALIDNPVTNGAASFSVQSVTLDSFSGNAADAPTVNPNYDGSGDADLLTGNSAFAVGDTAEVTLTVQVNPGSDGILSTENSSTTTATTASGSTVSDISQNGLNVDPDGDGNPTNNNEPSQWQGTIPQIGLAKAISAPIAVPNQPNVFDFDITYTVVNTGNARLDNVRLTDDLQEVLVDNPTVNGAASFTVRSVQVNSFSGSAANAPTPNPRYDGDTDQNLFTNDASAFARGDEAIVTLRVRIDLGSDRTLDTVNSATAIGTDPSGNPTTDISQNGNNPDPDGDGDPTNNNTPSPLQPEFPGIGLAKAISAARAVPNQANVFDFDITYLVENTGNTRLTNVQITDDLQEVLVDNPTTNGADSFTVQAVTLTSFSGNTADTPTANPNYDGDGNQNLFANSPNAFAIGDRATVTVTVRVDLGSDRDLNTENLATATGNSPGGQQTSDISQNGSNPDPDGDGDPTNNNAPSPWLPGLPQIGLAKAISTPTEVPNQVGVFEFGITYVVENTGNTRLNNVQVTDDLQDILIDNPTVDGAEGFTVQSVTVDSFTGSAVNAPAPNPSYNGNTNQNLLASNGNAFAVGDRATVTLIVRIDLGSDRNLNTVNSATATGIDPGGRRTSDISQNGSSIDPDGDGDPTNNNQPSPLRPTLPQIGIAKAISAPTIIEGQANVFDFDITYVVENAGNTILNNIQVTDDLQEVLIDNPTVDGAEGFTVQAITIDNFSGDEANAPTPNPDYDGDGDQNLLSDDANTLAIGDTVTITLTVRIDLGRDRTLNTDNFAIGTGTDPNNNETTDISQNGSDPDPDDDGDPTNNDAPSPIRPELPQIGLAKSITTPVAAPGQPGLFDFDITYVVVNTGNTRLNSVQITDDLQEELVSNPTTNGADSFTIQTITLDSFSGNPADIPTVNAGYDGIQVPNLFGSESNGFEVGDRAIITVTVRVDPGSDGILDTENSATAIGFSPNGTQVTDISQNGTSADSDDDGDPTNDDDSTPIVIAPTIDLTLVKRITNIFRQSAPLPVQGLGSFNDQPNTIADNELRNAFTDAGVANQPEGLFELPTGVELQPGDEVEYTLFFWNGGSVVVNQVQICDELQPPSILNTAAGFEFAAIAPLAEPIFGTGGGVVQGRSPGEPLEDFCLSAPGIFPFGPPGPGGGLGIGAGGGVTAGAFTIPANQFGAVRFRVRVP